MSDSKQPQHILRYTSLATEWLVVLLIAVWGGIKLDAWTKWKIPVFTILFPVAALVYLLWRVLKAFSGPKK